MKNSFTMFFSFSTLHIISILFFFFFNKLFSEQNLQLPAVVLSVFSTSDNLETSNECEHFKLHSAFLQIITVMQNLPCLFKISPSDHRIIE